MSICWLDISGLRINNYFLLCYGLYFQNKNYDKQIDNSSMNCLYHLCNVSIVGYGLNSK